MPESKKVLKTIIWTHHKDTGVSLEASTTCQIWDNYMKTIKYSNEFKTAGKNRNS